MFDFYYLYITYIIDLRCLFIGTALLSLGLSVDLNNELQILSFSVLMTYSLLALIIVYMKSFDLIYVLNLFDFECNITGHVLFNKIIKSTGYKPVKIIDIAIIKKFDTNYKLFYKILEYYGELKIINNNVCRFNYFDTNYEFTFYDIEPIQAKNIMLPVKNMFDLYVENNEKLICNKYIKDFNNYICNVDINYLNTIENIFRYIKFASTYNLDIPVINIEIIENFVNKIIITNYTYSHHIVFDELYKICNNSTKKNIYYINLLYTTKLFKLIKIEFDDYDNFIKNIENRQNVYYKIIDKLYILFVNFINVNIDNIKIINECPVINNDLFIILSEIKTNNFKLWCKKNKIYQSKFLNKKNINLIVLTLYRTTKELLMNKDYDDFDDFVDTIYNIAVKYNLKKTIIQITIENILKDNEYYEIFSNKLKNSKVFSRVDLDIKRHEILNIVKDINKLNNIYKHIINEINNNNLENNNKLIIEYIKKL